MSKAAKPYTAGPASSSTGGGGGVNMFDPIAMARSDPYFKRNHMGKVACTLCNVYCNDENAFIKHTAGKTHTLQLENMDRQRRKRLRLEEEERLDAEKAAAAAKAKATKDLLSSSAAASATIVTGKGGSQVLVGRFGTPLYTFRTEHEDTDAAAAATPPDGTAADAVAPVSTEVRGGYQTKVWLDFSFNKAEEGTRPLHRWLSAREQHVESPPDDYFVYLLVACEGYTTVALKFPAKLSRTQEGDAHDANGESVYRCAWDPLRKEYSMFFILSR